MRTTIVNLSNGQQTVGGVRNGAGPRVQLRKEIANY